MKGFVAVIMYIVAGIGLLCGVLFEAKAIEAWESTAHNFGWDLDNRVQLIRYRLRELLCCVIIVFAWPYFVFDWLLTDVIKARHILDKIKKE